MNSGLATGLDTGLVRGFLSGQLVFLRKQLTVSTPTPHHSCARKHTKPSLDLGFGSCSGGEVYIPCVAVDT